VGSTRAREILEQIRDGKGRPEDLETLKDLSDTMKMTSLCALGGLAPFPVLTAMQYFPKEFERKPRTR
jgi:formate dehydrogenase iron-sulfur subunit